MFKLYTYIMTSDTGFAPCLDYDECSLACCKPVIRRCVGNDFSDNDSIWIMGLMRLNKNNAIPNIIYFMKVATVVSFENYYPKYKKRMDCIYKKENASEGHFHGYVQLKTAYEHEYNPHSIYCSENPEMICEEKLEVMKTDISGKYVLMGNEFVYYGGKSIELPIELELLSKKYKNTHVRVFHDFKDENVFTQFAKNEFMKGKTLGRPKDNGKYIFKNGCN